MLGRPGGRRAGLGWGRDVYDMSVAYSKRVTVIPARPAEG